MPHIPDHLTHDPELVAAYAAGDATGPDLAAATELVASCTECADLHRDLRAIATALPELPPAVRPRDFRITPEQAASLRPSGWRGVLAAFASPRFRLAAPLGTGLAAAGLAGLLLASPGGLQPPPRAPPVPRRRSRPRRRRRGCRGLRCVGRLLRAGRSVTAGLGAATNGAGATGAQAPVEANPAALPDDSSAGASAAASGPAAAAPAPSAAASERPRGPRPTRRTVAGDSRGHPQLDRRCRGTGLPGRCRPRRDQELGRRVRRRPRCGPRSPRRRTTPRSRSSPPD